MGAANVQFLMRKIIMGRSVCGSLRAHSAISTYHWFVYTAGHGEELSTNAKCLSNDLSKNVQTTPRQYNPHKSFALTHARTHNIKWWFSDCVMRTVYERVS